MENWKQRIHILFLVPFGVFVLGLFSKGFLSFCELRSIGLVLTTFLPDIQVRGVHLPALRDGVATGEFLFLVLGQPLRRLALVVVH